MIVNNHQFLELVLDIFANGGSVRFRAHGWSMSPVIRDGDMLLAQAVDWESLNPGDIIMFRRDQRIVVHRLIDKNPSGTPSLYVRGDAPFHLKEKILPEQVLGRISEMYKDKRHIYLNSNIRRFTGLLMNFGISLFFSTIKILR